jgi:hypothetical protein
MPKQSVYVPAENQREAMVSYFANMNVRRLFPVTITAETLPLDSSDQTVEAFVEAQAGDYIDDDYQLSDIDGAFPVESEGRIIGWEVDLRITDREYYMQLEDQRYARESLASECPCEL